MTNNNFEKIKTPKEINEIIKKLYYFSPKEYTILSPKEILHRGRGHCFEMAILASYLNEKNSHKPLIMGFQFKKENELIGHAVHYFINEEGKFNSIGKSRIEGLGSKMNNYETKNDLINAYFNEYKKNNSKLIEVVDFNLNEFNHDWRVEGISKSQMEIMYRRLKKIRF